MPTIPERLETATSSVEASAATLSAALATATTAATNAGNSATAAAASATTATTQATTATTKAGEAATSATNAATSATAAGTSATNAGNSANAAATSATNAGTSETNAGNSATAAAGSATAAATSATNAGNSATSAATSATNAATSEGNALTSKNAAATSAGNASTSATAAATSAAQAAAIAAGLNYKGVQSGATVPNTSTNAGDCYLITTAGTSQTKTWAVGDLAVYRGPSGTWDQIPATVVMGIAAALRNALSARQAIYCDGTAATAAIKATFPALTGYWTVALTVLCPLVSPAVAMGMFALGNVYGSAGAFSGYIAADGSLNFQQDAGAFPAYRGAQVSGFVSKYAGKLVHLTAVVSPGALKIYIDGQDTAFVEGSGAGAPAWGDTLSTTAYRFATLQNGNYFFAGILMPPLVENRAFTATEVQSLLEKMCPDRIDFVPGGITANYYASDFSAGANGWSGDSVSPATGNVDGLAAENDWLKVQNVSGVANYARAFRSIPNAVRNFRLTGKAYNPTGATIYLTVRNTSDASLVAGTLITIPANSAATFDVSGQLKPNQTAIEIWQSGAGGAITYGVQNNDYWAVKNLVFTPLGACFAPANNPPGNGLVWNDQSFNVSPLVMPPAGMYWNLPSQDTNRIRATTSTNGNQQLLGAQLVGGLSQLLRIRARARSGTPTVTLGTFSGGSNIVASVALSTSWKNLTVALTDGIIGGASIWAGSNSTDVVEWDIALDPLSFSANE